LRHKQSFNVAKLKAITGCGGWQSDICFICSNEQHFQRRRNGQCCSWNLQRFSRL